jgi:hypothetical protein
MGVDSIGSGVIIAVAALLWLVYLVPTWLRRREYLATEHNAVRLQQTLRILAETAEAPVMVRAETSARSAAQQERSLKKLHQMEAAVALAKDASLARTAARRLVETQPAIAADVAVSSSASRRLRRSRAVTSGVLLVALIATGVGVVQLVTAGSWMLAAGGGLVTAGSFAMLGQMASVGRARAELARTLRARAPIATRTTASATAVPVVAVQTTWTPVPLPKPLYAGRPQVDRAVLASLQAAADLRQAAADAEQKLRVAAAEAEQKLREAHQEPEVIPMRPSRFASMGIVEATETRATDLDAVLRIRRRNVG